MFANLPDLKYGRVLDVACKDGQVTKDYLAKKFQTVDMFDKDLCEIAKAKRLLLDYRNIGNIDCVSMEDYNWEEKYNCVFIRWGIGYLSDG